jgi:hypothetical protein
MKPAKLLERIRQNYRGIYDVGSHGVRNRIGTTVLDAELKTLVAQILRDAARHVEGFYDGKECRRRLEELAHAIETE